MKGEIDWAVLVAWLIIGIFSFIFWAGVGWVIVEVLRHLGII